MNPVQWGLLASLSALASGAFVYIILQSCHQVELSRQREELAEARGALAAQKQALEESLRTVEETTRRKAMDEFLAEIRIEERIYTREQKMLFMNRKSLVRQERIFFRNIPLSNWIEQEMLIEEGADVDKLAKTMSVFAGEALAAPGADPVRKLLR